MFSNKLLDERNKVVCNDDNTTLKKVDNLLVFRHYEMRGDIYKP